MDNYITRTELLIVSGGIVTLYILVRLIKFYWIGYLERLNQKIEVYESGLFSDSSTPSEEDTNTLKELEILINRIRYDILVKAGTTATKDQLLDAISEKVAGFDGLHQPAHRYALNNFIIHHCQNICGVLIDKDELEAIWNDQPRITRTL